MYFAQPWMTIYCAHKPTKKYRPKTKKTMAKITTNLKETMMDCSPVFETALTQDCKARWERLQDMIDHIDEDPSADIRDDSFTMFTVQYYDGKRSS